MLFNQLIRKPKVTKQSSKNGGDEALGVVADRGATIVRGAATNIPPSTATTCNRCGIDHWVKDCPARQKAKPKQALLLSENGPETLPTLRDVPSAERIFLFKKKLALCTVIYDFMDPSKNTQEKEIKKQTLVELVEYVTVVGTAKISETALEETFRMISTNMFRTLPVPSHDAGPGGDAVFDTEEEEPILDPAWQHVQLVYEFLLRYLTHQETDPRLAKRHIDQSFVLQLMELFDSEDPRERDSLKMVLHRIYGKFMVHRAFIRKAINYTFYCFIFETERHNGVGEMLEILGSVINGFALPLKEEHKLFLVRALIPLHKPKCLLMYHQQLSYCIIQVVEKDFKLADTVIRGLLKFWPVTNSHKEVIMLGELEEVLEATQPAEFQRCVAPLFRQISRSLNSPHFQVAERSLMLWNSDHIVSLIAQNRQVILPLIFSALEKNSNGHWNQAVHGLMQNVRKMFQELDMELFEECLKSYHEHESRAKAMEEQRDAIWKRLEELAATNTSSGLVMAA